MTTQQTFEKAQREAMPQEDLAEYAGLWVAVREGHVVGSSPDPVALRSVSGVDIEDTLMPVPVDGESTLII